MNTTKIEWTEKTWNPSVGCSKVSVGCKNCYAESFAKRLHAIGIEAYSNGFQFKILPERLNFPLSIKKPTKFFVNSMSDLFHENMPYEYLDSVFEVIQKTPQHIYQILTKREQNMYSYFQTRKVPENVWLGVSVENSQNKYRIDVLRKVKAKVRFISFEPLLGNIGKLNLKGIHWVIVGGESGRRARPMKVDWVMEIFRMCKARNVAFFFKQWGTYGEDEIKRSKYKNGMSIPLFLSFDFRPLSSVLRPLSSEWESLETTKIQRVMLIFSWNFHCSFSSLF